MHEPLESACSEAAGAVAKRPGHGVARRRASALLGSTLGAAAILGLLAGCGGGSQKSVDNVTVARAIAASILSQHRVRTSVSCPAKVPAVAGIGFTCVARLDAGSYPVAVIVKDSAGHVRYGNRAPLVVLDIARVQRSITASIRSQRHLAATVRCPADVLGRAGLKFLCTAQVAARAYPFAVEEIDSSGHVRYRGT